MDSFRKPETVLALGAIFIAGGSAVYTNNKINALTQSLDKVIAQVDAIGKKMGELKISEINENREQLKHLIENLRKLDRFTYQLKHEVDDFHEIQQLDNESIQELVNAIVAASELQDAEPLDLGNVEEPKPKKKKKNKGKSQPTTKRVQFSKPAPESEDDEEEDDVTSRLEKLRKKRR